MTRILTILTVVGFFVASCTPEMTPTKTEPNVITHDVTNITSNSATLSGEVTSNGGDSLIAKGILWSTVQGVTMDNNEGFTEDAFGLGPITVELKGLKQEISYFARAYATNIMGAGYGDEKTFTTLPIETGTVTDSRDGKVYKTVKIGNQWWMAENLNVGTMVNGSQDQTDNGTIEKYCYGNDPANCEIYGGLYQWYEMMGYNPPETVDIGTIQSVCPAGWHLPTESEWTNLMEMAGVYKVAGGKLKSVTSDWREPDRGDATNELLFTGLPAGHRVDYTQTVPPYYVGLGGGTRFWTTTEGTIIGLTKPWFFELGYNNGSMNYGITDYIYGQSVRCVKD